MTKRPFTRIILFARQYRAEPGIQESLSRLVLFLQHRAYDVCVEKNTARYFPLNVPLVSREDLGAPGDLIVVVGGDGSLLSAARMAVSVQVPVIGVNRGQLGFLTDISPQLIEQQLGPVLDGHFQAESRFLLDLRIYTGDTLYFEGSALNDVVLSRGNTSRLIQFDLWVDGEYVSRYRSDGMVIATPTGSTAYALSAGGPILHPTMDAVVLVPMFSHSLSSRPLVISGSSEILLQGTRSNSTPLHLSCDGLPPETASSAQKVHITKNPQHLTLLHPAEYTYYDTLRTKLGWESKFQGT